jgi:hypothetical protein
MHFSLFFKNVCITSSALFILMIACTPTMTGRDGTKDGHSLFSFFRLLSPLLLGFFLLLLLFLDRLGRRRRRRRLLLLLSSLLELLLELLRRDVLLGVVSVRGGGGGSVHPLGDGGRRAQKKGKTKSRVAGSAPYFCKNLACVCPTPPRATALHSRWRLPGSSSPSSRGSCPARGACWDRTGPPPRPR